ncbi:RNA-binding domain-containing protein [Companilactobacillus metriopterae]|uniref:RNA-binding domain-containing protein n=1 Tax=Companilactobacillus metriopterae TaxID=1909267 RepID=UPI00100B902F|nr:RNA-binding domain-containing protein [Companilactobacillus metriopterae]
MNNIYTLLDENNLTVESLHLEYKTASNALPKEFWPTYSAFANTSGGSIILGISEEKKGEYNITGVKNAQHIVTDLLTTLNNKNKVSINLIHEKNDILEYTVDGKKIIIINIKEASYKDKPVFINGNKSSCFKRIGDGDTKLDDTDYRYMITNSQENLDGGLLDHYTVDDLNPNDIEDYRNTLIENSNNDYYKNLTTENFLQEIGAMEIDRSNSNRTLKLNKAGLLFFGNYNAIVSQFSGFQLDFFYKKSSRDSKWQDRISTGDLNYPNLNIYSFYKYTLGKLYLRIEDSFSQDENMTRGSYFSDIKIAVKEALVNSLVHAYYGSDEPIKIYSYETYFEFYNPGDLRISKEEFIHGSKSRPRNPGIATLFRKIGVAERAGSGGPTIFQAAYKNSLRSPDIINNPENTTIRIWKTNLMDSMDGLSPDEKKIIEYAVKNPIFKVKDILENTNLKEWKARDILKTLVEKNILDLNRKGKATSYSISLNDENGILSINMLLKSIEDIIN